MDSNLFAEIRGHELERECKDTEIILEEDEMDKIKQNGGGLKQPSTTRKSVLMRKLPRSCWHMSRYVEIALIIN